MKKTIFLISILMFCSCYYTFYANRFPHINDVKIEYFGQSAQSLEFELSNDFYDLLKEKFIESNVFDIVEDKEDAYIMGDFLEYTKELYTAEDAADQLVYNVSVTYSYEFYSHKDGKALLEEKSVRESLKYSTSGSSVNVGSESIEIIGSEEEAVAELLDRIADDIVLKITKSW